jgi:hypothetical protein
MPGNLSADMQSKKKSPTDYQSWHDRAKAANPNMTDVQIMEQAVKLGYK